MTATHKIWACLSGDVLERYVPAGAGETMEAVVYASYLDLLGDVPTAIHSGWVPVGDDRVAWGVVVGYALDEEIPAGGDSPMRNGVALAWRAINLPGAYNYLRSGWCLEGERGVIGSALRRIGSNSV